MKTLQHPDKFAHDLTGWFRKNKRDLPFRFDKDPYRIFVSELMLQQTKIDTMIPYYERFMRRFPTATDLADASLDEVMELWAGLGYYRRARYLHESARMIRDEHGGVFPETLKDIEALKGVGRYTARAIHSIAFGHPSPAVDGNVMRVMSRVLGYDGDIRKTRSMRDVEGVLDGIITHADPGDFTEALMEIGALVCKKTSPLCESCPLKDYCFAYKQEKQDAFPVISKRAAKREHHLYTFVISAPEGYLLIRRPKTGVLAGMYAFPQYEKAAYEEARKAFEDDFGISLEGARLPTTVKHVFTHKVWHMRIVTLNIPALDASLAFAESRLKTLPTAHRKILEHI